MAHYADAIAGALSRHGRVFVLGGASGQGVLSSWRLLRRLLRDRSVTVLNTSPHWSVPMLLATTPMRGGYVMHGPLVYMASRWTRPLYIGYYRFLTRRLGVVVLHSERFRESLKKLGLRPRRVVVVPHAFVPHGLAESGEYDPAGRFVWVGRLLPYKGIDVFVAALEALAKDGRGVPALIGGQGVTDDLVVGEIPHLEVRRGPLSDEELREAIDRGAAVVLPYRQATQSGVLSTALAAGRPVIATDVGSFPDYVDGTNGILVDPDDAPALADALWRIRSDSTLARRLAEGARRTWEDRLDPDAAARRILDALGS
jgi:glycosyltransferase involved in cell wall biosynthesis